MTLPDDFLALLRPTTLEEIIASTKREDSTTRHHAYLELRNEVTPLELFCYLGARFGPPNGIQNLFRKDHSDNLVHWDWTLKYNDSLIFIWGGNFRTELTVIGEILFTEVEKVDLIRQIQADLKYLGPRMSEIRKGLEHWTEFVNPFWRLSRAIASLQAELADLNLSTEFTEDFNTPLTVAENPEKWSETSANFGKAFGLCFGIRSMLPVKAEAFINLLIYATARPDIRSDTRLLDSIFRQQIDIRVKSLHINCVGFEKAVDYTDAVCKRFHTLINGRNDLLHGNVVPEKQKFNDVYFLGKVPIFTKYRSLWDRTIAVDSQAVGIGQLDAELLVVTDFIEYVLTCLKPEIRNLMRAILKKRDLARESSDGRLGILFPDNLIDSRPYSGQEP